MAGRLPRVTGATGSIDTAGKGYFIGFTVNAIGLSVGTIVVSANQVRLFNFILPFRAVVGNITSRVTTGGGSGKKYSVGLYDNDKNLLLHTGALDANTVQINSTAITSVTLEPGHYWFAQTTDSASTQLSNVSVSAGLGDMINDDTAQIGQAANSSSVGVLPATLGTISASMNRQAAAVVFSP